MILANNIDEVHTIMLIEILLISSLAFGIKNYQQQRQPKTGSNQSLKPK